ncbi:hypothetical protein IPA_05505 [Ignicoccus pacificus DSM 13166]|uniref:Glycosyltransferase 2-like domain-containing protein n=1 Tax=Ignicoccus pacificus DSM 13166 TaxID=940294 RepID=A0A977KCP0_9CREN|nr:hypothetical protein IPA_05505 [Ignicoccus pacificus DSM 13166]
MNVKVVKEDDVEIRALNFEKCKSAELVSISVYFNAARSEKRKELTIRALRSFIDIEIENHALVLVDNGSIDSTIEVLMDEVLRSGSEKCVLIVRLPKNLGFARANEIGYKLAKGLSKQMKYVALINDDVVVDEKKFKELYRILEDTDVCGVQGILLHPTGKLDSASLYFSPLLAYGGTVGSAEYLPALALFPSFTSYLDGALSIYNEECLKGKLFEPYCFMYGDDYELGTRLTSENGKLLFVPIVVGTHHRGLTRTSSTELHRKIMWWGGFCSSSLSMSLINVPKSLFFLELLLRNFSITMVIALSKVGLFKNIKELVRLNKSFMEGSLFALFRPAPFRRRKSVLLEPNVIEMISSLSLSVIPACFVCRLFPPWKRLRRLLRELEKTIHPLSSGERREA